MSRVLVTGGTGYIGSNVAALLSAQGDEVTVLDDLSRSRLSVVADIASISGPATFTEVDARDSSAVLSVMEAQRIDTVIHLAGWKSAPESVARPIEYYDRNVGSLVSVLQASHACGVKRFVFSGSATVYSPAIARAITEDDPVAPSTPYGHSKAICERILQDYASANPDVAVTSLRYFNPVGAHPSGILGEDPLTPAGNLLPILLRVARSWLPWLNVYGTEYDTPDGTALRDYVHVTDLAYAHRLALLRAPKGFRAYNVGTGQTVSVLGLRAIVSQVTGVPIDAKERPPRPGDAPIAFCDPTRIREELNWTPMFTVEQAVESAWRHAMKDSASHDV